METWQIALIVAVGLLGGFLFYLKALSKGEMGEFVARLVIKFLGKNYKSFHDVTFNDGEKTVQIDHLIVSAYGIFVVETKNYTGTIYGKENYDKFIKYSGNKKYEFYSPIKQNAGHIFSLKKVLGAYKYISVVVFSGLAKLKIESQTFVGYIGDMSRYIKQFKEIVLSQNETDEICQKINQFSLKGSKVHKRHVDDIKERMEEYNTKLRKNICPKCGGNLVLRKGQYGEFYGCSNYPRCKFIKR